MLGINYDAHNGYRLLVEFIAKAMPGMPDDETRCNEKVSAGLAPVS
jgi:hypothetical protein